MSPVDNAVLEHRVTVVETVLEDIGESIKSIAESMKTLAVLEERHVATKEAIARAFIELKDNKTQTEHAHERIDKIELEMPHLKRMAALVWSALVGCVTLLGAGIWFLVSGGRIPQAH